MTQPPMEPVVATPGPDEHRHTFDSGAALRDGLVVVAVLVVGGLVAGVVWAQLVDPVVATRSAAGVASPESELVKQVAADGWFAVLGFGLCLVTGLALTWWRRRDELVTLFALTVGSLLAAWVCATLGAVLGPEPAVEALAEASEGEQAPDQLQVSAATAYLAWPTGAVLGNVIVLLGVRGSHRPRPRPVVQ